MKFITSLFLFCLFLCAVTAQGGNLTIGALPQNGTLSQGNVTYFIDTSTVVQFVVNVDSSAGCLNALLLSGIDGFPITPSWPEYQVNVNSDSSRTIMIRQPPRNEFFVNLILTQAGSSSCNYAVTASFATLTQYNTGIVLQQNISYLAYNFFQLQITPGMLNVVEFSFTPIQWCEQFPYVIYGQAYASEFLFSYGPSNFDISADRTLKVIILPTAPQNQLAIGIRSLVNYSQVCQYQIRQYAVGAVNLSVGNPINAESVPINQYKFYQVAAPVGVWTLYVTNINLPFLLFSRNDYYPNEYSNATNENPSRGLPEMQLDIVVALGVVYLSIQNIGNSAAVTYNIQLDNPPNIPTAIAPTDAPAAAPTDGSIKPGTIVGIIIGCAAVAALVIGVIFFVQRHHKPSYETI